MERHRPEQIAFGTDAEIRDWVKRIGKFYFFITITPRHSWISRMELEKALNLAINKINRMAIGRVARLRKRSLASFAVIEGGWNGEQIHAHLLLGETFERSLFEMRNIIERALNSIRSFGYHDIRRYREERHLAYVLKQGPEALFLEGCRFSK